MAQAISKMETTQTPVQWLALRYHHRQGYLSQEDIEQAKAMEKHQTLVFGMKCQADYIKYDFNRNIVDIYNETYNK